MWADVRVAVSGGAGFIGSHLCQRLVFLGAKVMASAHKTPPSFHHPNLHYVEGDLQEESICKKLVQGADYVFHCAAVTSGAAAIKSTPMMHVTPNVVMNARLLEASWSAGIKKFLFLSSNAAYPPTDRRPTEEKEMFIGDPYEAYYFAGWMKRYGEILCRTYTEKVSPAMPCVVLRPSNIYGPGDKFDPHRSHVTAALLRKVLERQHPVEVWGTGEDHRDLLYIDDFITAMTLAMEKVTGFLPLNIASGKTHSVRAILQLLLEITGYTEAEILLCPEKPSMIPYRALNTELAQRILEFSPETSLRDGLSKTVAWYQDKKL
jgi:GDP-L-fucose synthase